jgi:hypothetical protein
VWETTCHGGSGSPGSAIGLALHHVMEYWWLAPWAGSGRLHAKHGIEVAGALWQRPFVGFSETGNRGAERKCGP